MYIVGDSMEPAFEHGDVALVHPHSPPRPGKNVLVFRDRHGTTEAMVKRLVKVTPTEWHLHQFNPPLDFSLPRSEWPYAHLIVGAYSSR